MTGSHEIPRITANADGTFTSTISGPVTTEEKAQKKNGVKVRSMLLMALSNEHLLTFSQYNDAKTLFEAIQARFGDLEQIHEDDLEKIDLKWQLALLSMRARRSPRIQESWPRNQDNSRKTMIVEDTSSKATVAIDGAGFDWSYMGDDEVPTNMALMAFSDSKSRIVPVSTARQSSSRVAAPVSTARPINTVAPKPIVNVAKSRRNAFQKTHLLSRRPFHQQTTLKNRYLVNTAKGKSVTSDVGKQGSNVVKSSACWVWRPKIKGDPQATLRDTRIFDSGCSRHMTGKKFFLSEYQEFDGGFVAFAGSSKGDTECVVLSPNFKLLDESQVLLRVPRKNMYIVDLRNVAPSVGLTCLFAKATLDESNH
nr:hypothetical protein [Tanacetum cinerariifolium]